MQAASSVGARRSMRANRSKDTGPERGLRAALWAAGLRGYRKHAPGVCGRPDVAFTRWRVAAFVAGCFWHRCPTCAKKRNLVPSANRGYWAAKFGRNVERDAGVRASLAADGWTVVWIWECELAGDRAACVERVSAALESAGRAVRSPRTAQPPPARRPDH
ncbi:MAG: very short patch repair endonuclease [Armatimonadetes bacterium]|nr:very short patch repair endonuclease [Armatimonadota bacterium]